MESLALKSLYKSKLALFIPPILFLLCSMESMMSASFNLATLSYDTTFLAPFYADKNVLVTGGAGFIGSHLVEQLVEVGAHVTVLDNFSTGSVENLKAVIDDITIMNATITDLKTCEEAVQGQEIIFHLAADISVAASVHDPLHCHETNVSGTLNLLQVARNAGISAFLFASSSAIYGNQPEQVAEHKSGKPISPYGVTKLLGELYCSLYSRIYNLNTVRLRYFNVYGKRQNPKGAYAAVVAAFRHAMTQNAPITIYGNGNQARDFVPVEKVVFANMLLAVAPPQEVGGHVYNIASGQLTSINDLFYTLRLSFPSYTLEPQYAPARDGDVYMSHADCEAFDRLVVKLTPLLRTHIDHSHPNEEYKEEL